MICPFCQQPVGQFLPPPEGGSGLRCPLCGEEGVPVLYPVEYDTHPAVPVCILGPTGHGKTVFIEALLTHLERRCRWDGFSAQWMDQVGMRASRERLRQLRDHGQLPDATAAVFPRPQVIRLRNVPRVGGCQLLFYDTSGETFGDVELLRDRGRYVRNTPVVLWLVSLAELEYPEQLADLMTVYAQAMVEMGADPKKQTVIFTLTKGDLLIDLPDLPPEARNFLLNDTLDPDDDAWRKLESLSNALAGWLLATDHYQIVNLLRGLFKAVRFCVLSAQGTAARDQLLQMDLMPRGVLAPLFWLWREVLPIVWVDTPAGREPFFSISDAAASAPPGSTIRLNAREYALPTRIELRHPLTIAGSGPEETVLSCGGPGFVVGVGIGSGKVVFDGLTLLHTGDQPADVIRVVRGSLELRNCAVRGGLIAPDKVPGDGVRVGGEAAAMLIGCTLEENQGAGVSAVEKSVVVLRDCEVRVNGGAGVSAAGASVEVVGCKVSKNGLNGVHLTSAVRGGVRNSTCHSNKKSGIAAFLDAAVELTDNTCEANGLDGIVLKDRVVASVDGNVCLRNQQAGISVHDTVAGLVSRNRCAENRLAGIELEDHASPTVEDNECSRNRGSGIAYSGAAAGKCVSNTCDRNQTDGIAVAGAASPEVEGNRCLVNERSGFRVAEGAAPTIGKQNAASDNVKGDYHPAKWGRRGWFG